MELEARPKKRITVSDIIRNAALSLVLAPIAMGFFFAFFFGPDVAYSLPDFLVIWFFGAFTLLVNAMAVIRILENIGLTKVTLGSQTGPWGTLFYILFSAFLNYILIKELRTLIE